MMNMEVIGTGPRQYCEDIDMLCVTGVPERVAVLQDDAMYVRLALLAMVCPDVELQSCIYNSSGHSNKDDLYKVSMQLVYNVTVNEERYSCPWMNGVWRTRSAWPRHPWTRHAHSLRRGRSFGYA